MLQKHVDDDGNIKVDDIEVQIPSSSPGEEEPREELKRPPSAVLSNADYKKKEKQRPKFEKITTKINTKKDDAAAKFKTGLYAEAITCYNSAAEILAEALEDFPMFRREIAQ